MKNKKIILTIASCVGVAASIVLTHRNTIKAMENAEDEKKWKYYIPTILSGTFTIVTIILNHKITNDELKALLATSATSFATLSKYRKKVKEIAGEDAYITIEKELAKDEEKGILNVNPSIWRQDITCAYVEPIEKGKTLFYESQTNTWFRSSMSAVMSAIYHTNRNFALKSYISLNEYLSFLGIESDDYTDIGWSYDLYEDGIYWIDFDVIESKEGEEYDGEKYYIITPVYEVSELEEE